MNAQSLYAMLVCALSLFGGWSACRRTSGPEVFPPQPALERLQQLHAKTVYFNGPVFRAVQEAAPAWLPESDRGELSARVRALVQAAQSPKLFRQMDRQERFDALWLYGDPIQCKPLLEHLIQSGDWVLDWVDPASLVYVRGREETITMERIRAAARAWDGAPRRRKAEALAGMVDRLVAAHRKDAGAELLKMAREADSGSEAVWVAEGNYRLARGEWAKAVDAAAEALRIDPRNRPARSVKAQGLYYLRRFLQAYEISQMLLREAPGDPVMLFNHAKIAHEVRAFEEEIEILRKLIAMAEKEERSASWYRVFLGQALATTGKGPEALAAFRLALQDAELPQEQRAFATEAMRRVESMIAPIRVTN